MCYDSVPNFCISSHTWTVFRNYKRFCLLIKHMQSIGLLSIYFNFLDLCLIILFQNLPSCIVGHWTLCYVSESLYGLFFLIVVNIKKGFLINGLWMLQVKWPLHDNQSHSCISAVIIFVLCLFEIPQLFLVMIKAELISLFSWYFGQTEFSYYWLFSLFMNAK